MPGRFSLGAAARCAPAAAARPAFVFGHFAFAVAAMLPGPRDGAHAAETAAAEASGDYCAQRQQLDQVYQQQLAELAARCRQLHLPEQAAATAAWFTPRDPRRQYFFLPVPTDPLRPPADAPTIERQWHARLTQLRQSRAAELFQLARGALERGHAARAYQLLHETLHEDPDHATARRALGYRQVDGRWARPTAAVRARQVRAANPAIGLGGPYWVIDSENFSVATDHSEQMGRQLAERLEVLHAVWEQLFFDYWSNVATLARRLEGQGAAARGGPRHNVVLFRDREAYLAHLKPSEPLIELTVGMYMDRQKTAYFYADAQTDDDIYFHEVTHQLFSETGRAAPGAGLENNFWIIEGVALYMESLRPGHGCWMVGGVDADRLQYARYRLLNEGFYVPLDQLTALGRRALQEHPEIRRLYSQAAGLTAMLMDHDRGRYRQPLVVYLQAIYAGRARAETLAAAIGQPNAELDAQYRRFLEVTDADLAYLAALPSATELSLGHTSVSDAGLAHLAGHTQLRWLDLTATGVTDVGFASVAAATRLQHLILEQTAVGDPSLEIIAGFRELEILDLTGTRISDSGLAQLAGLTKLRELWIGQTAIGDAGLQHLQKLSSLTTLDVGGTRVTAEGWQRLRAALPELKD